MFTSLIYFCTSHFYSITAPLQNALDWALFPENLLKQKPIGFIGLYSKTKILSLIKTCFNCQGYGSQLAIGDSCYHIRQQCSIAGAVCLNGPQDPFHEKPAALRQALEDYTGAENLTPEVWTIPLQSNKLTRGFWSVVQVSAQNC